MKPSKAIVTGAGGTVGSVLCNYLREQGVQVIPWNRKRVSTEIYEEMDRFIQEVQPDVLYHLALGSYHWTGEIAWITRQRGIRFIYTSTVMVFTNEAQGPFTPESQPDATEGYGGEKRRQEERIWHQNPEATVVRLGWQIGKKPGSNNMIQYLYEQMQTEGKVRASTEWLPACSFLEDTAAALWKISEMPSGLYHLNSNQQWNFCEITTALNRHHGYPWHIFPTHDFVYDQRMQDSRITLPPLEQRLPELSS